MSWCWRTLTTTPPASSAADGCYCCNMTWRQCCPTLQLFLCSMEPIFIYYVLQQQGSHLLFLLKPSHLHRFPRWTAGHRYAKRLRAAKKGKRVHCYAACTPPRWPPALHTTSASWLDGVNRRQNPGEAQIGFLNHLRAGVITAAALSQDREEAAHHPHPLNVQFIKKKKKK